MKSLAYIALIASLSLGISSSFAKEKPSSPEVILKAELGSPIVEAGKVQTTFLKVGLTGFTLDTKADRTPANIAIVLDKSGSMRGEKLARAKEAANLAIDLLNEQDIVSVISYDSVVDVLIPATRVSDKKKIKQAIHNMRANASTALFAGVSKGAAEVRKFMDQERVNRVILLSDGQANIGPSSATELGELGASLGKDGLSVTTIGLGAGYNEDLMANLAGFSDGNHAFVEKAEDLAKVFQYEFGDVLSVVAQDVTLKIECEDGVKPIRLLGRNGTIQGQTVTTRLNQLYSEQEKYVLLEVEVPAGQAETEKDLARVDVVYQNMQSQKADQLNHRVNIAYSDSVDDVQQALNSVVVKDATKQIANEFSKKALQLRDAGQREEARQLLLDSADYIQQQTQNLAPSAAVELEAYSEEIKQDAANVVQDERWNENRKSLKARQYKLEKQQAY